VPIYASRVKGSDHNQKGKFDRTVECRQRDSQIFWQHQLKRNYEQYHCGDWPPNLAWMRSMPVTGRLMGGLFSGVLNAIHNASLA
jgi:hypothetical protein